MANNFTCGINRFRINHIRIPPALFTQNFTYFQEVSVFHIAGDIDFPDSERDRLGNFRIRIGGAAVQYQRDRHSSGNIAQDVHLQFRLHPFWIDAVRGTNRHRQGIDAGTSDKILRLRRVGISHFRHSALYRRSRLADGPQFTFDRDANRMRQPDHFPR